KQSQTLPLLPSFFHKIAIGLRAAIAEELPHVPDFLNLIQIEIRDDHLFFIARSFGNDLSPRRAEVTLAVKLSNIPRVFASNSIDRPDEITVRNRMGRLFEFPEIFAQAGDGCRRIKYDFGAIQTERARALREVAVVAYVHANVGELRLEDRIAEIARSEIKLLPKTGSTVWDVVLAIFAQVFAVRIDYGSGVVID